MMPEPLTSGKTREGPGAADARTRANEKRSRTHRSWDAIVTRVAPSAMAAMRPKVCALHIAGSPSKSEVRFMAPQLPLTGGCLCGAVRYEVRTRPFFVYLCHCTDCQRRSGAAFCMGMPVPRESFAVIRGAPERVDCTTPSGSQTIHNHCPVCRIRTHSEPQAYPASVNVRPGTLDDTKWVAPVAQIWVRSAQPWALVPGLTQYETDPDFPAMLAAFAKIWPT